MSMESHSMNILGVSGLPNALPFKQDHWPGLDPREYRIAQGYDAAAALVSEGELIAAAAEERFNRRKHTGEFPVEAASYCLAEHGIDIQDVDEIAHGFNYSAYQGLYAMDPVTNDLYNRVFSREAFLNDVERHFPGFPPERVHQVP